MVINNNLNGDDKMSLLDFLDTAFDALIYSGAKNSRSTLIDAQRKAHNAGNTQAEATIKARRSEVESLIKQMDEEKKRNS